MNAGWRKNFQKSKRFFMRGRIYQILGVLFFLAIVLAIIASFIILFGELYNMMQND